MKTGIAHLLCYESINNGFLFKMMDLLKLYAFGDLKSGPVQGIWDEN